MLRAVQKPVYNIGTYRAQEWSRCTSRAECAYGSRRVLSRCVAMMRLCIMTAGGPAEKAGRPGTRCGMVTPLLTGDDCNCVAREISPGMAPCTLLIVGLRWPRRVTASAIRLQ